MNGQELLDEMSTINTDLVEDAVYPAKSRRSHRKALVIAACAVLLLGGITYASGIKKTPMEHTEPTGYPTGQLQQEFVFYSGNVYVYAVSYVESLPEDYVKVGEILSVDNQNMP